MRETRIHGRRRYTVLAPAALGLGLLSCATKSPALHPGPSFSAAPTRQTVNAIDAGDGDLEIANLRRVMMSHPDEVDGRLRLAQAYTAHGFPDVALEHYRLASERFPESANAALWLARALRQSGQNQEALAGLSRFLAAHPQKSQEPYEWLGILNDDLENWKASEAAYQTALIYSPQSAELHNNLGYALLMQAMNNAAAQEFRTALRLNHDLTIARNNLGIALAANPQDAISHWQAMSGPAAAHNNMAALLIERGDLRGARKELETALSYDRQNAQALFNLALVSERDGKPALIPDPKSDAHAGHPSFLARLFHGGQHPEPAKPQETKTSAAAQHSTVPPGERTLTPSSSGSGN